ncbi:MAG TPA: CYTH domain-containing protein [Vicinamibacterales bacterium]|nr:CYTH domain-containing protein [Vicinamibacterales bacterium]
MLEREVKLRFADPEQARAAVRAAGATPLRGRRLQEDCLLDTADERLRRRRCVLRVRLESGKSLLTFKGPVEPSPMKLREELETVVGDGLLLLQMLAELGFHVWFRYQKYREEFSREGVIVAVDETPVGVFVELEGDERLIAETATALGRSAADYVVDSYRTLFVQDCRARGVEPTDMVFEEA